jgi:hypothetical protein
MPQVFSATILALPFMVGESTRNAYEAMMFLFVQVGARRPAQPLPALLIAPPMR